jgi:hypothetical protein
VLGLAWAVGTGWVYQWILDIVPFVYLNFLIAGIYGAGIGAPVAYACVIGRCRNPFVCVALAVVVGLGGVAASHGFAYLRAVPKLRSYMRAVARKESGRLTAEELQDASRSSSTYQRLVETLRARQERKEQDPEVEAAYQQALADVDAFMARYSFGDYLADRAESGWSIWWLRSPRGIPIRGVLAWIVWLLEAGGICFLATVFPRAAVDKPFCERCSRWTAMSGSGRLEDVDPAAARRAAVTGDLAALLRTPPGKMRRRELAFDIWSCAGCDARYLSVSLHRPVRDSEGKMQDESKDLLKYVIVTPEQATAFESPPRDPPA